MAQGMRGEGMVLDILNVIIVDTKLFIKLRIERKIPGIKPAVLLCDRQRQEDRRRHNLFVYS